MTVNLDQALVAYLQGNSGLIALISTRVYLRKIPQSATLPCLTLRRISTAYTHTMDTAGATGNLTRPRFQFDAWATTYAVSKSITDALKAALNGHTGSTGGATIRAALIENEQSDDGGDPATGLERSQSDYFIWHEEA